MSKTTKNALKDIKLKGKCTIIKIVQTGMDSGNNTINNNIKKENLKPNKLIPFQEKQKILNKINYAKNQLKPFYKEKNKNAFLNKDHKALYIKKANSNAHIVNRSNNNIKQYISEKNNKNKNIDRKEIINKVLKDCHKKNEKSLKSYLEGCKNQEEKILENPKNNLFVARKILLKNNSVDDNINNNLTIKNIKQNSCSNLLKDDEIYRKPSVNKNFSKSNLYGNNIDEILVIENHLDKKCKKCIMPSRSSSSNNFIKNMIEISHNKIRKTENELRKKIKVNKIINKNHQKNNLSLNFIHSKHFNSNIYKSPKSIVKKTSNEKEIKNENNINNLINSVSIRYTKKNIKSPLLSKNKTPIPFVRIKPKLKKSISISKKNLNLKNKTDEKIKIENNNDLTSETDFQIKNKEDEVQINFNINKNIENIINSEKTIQKNNNIKNMKRNHSISFSLDECQKNKIQKKLNKTFSYLPQNEDSISINAKTKNDNVKTISSSKKEKKSLIIKEIFFPNKLNINKMSKKSTNNNLFKFNDSGSDDIMNSNNNSYNFKNNNSCDFNDIKNRSQNNLSNSPLKNYYFDYYNNKNLPHAINEKLINPELLNKKEYYKINYPMSSYTNRNLNSTENFGNRIRKFSPLRTDSQPFFPTLLYSPYNVALLNRINTFNSYNNIRNNNINNNLDYCKPYIIKSNNNIKVRNSQDENSPNLGSPIINQTTTPTQSEQALSNLDINNNVNCFGSNSADLGNINENKNVFDVNENDNFNIKFVNNQFLNNNNDVASDIREILNKVTYKNYQIMKNNLIPKIITENENYEELFINILYPFAINQKNNQTIYAKLCKDIDKFYNKKEKAKSIMRNQLMKLCKLNFKKIKTCLHNINLILNDINFIGELINVQMVSKKVGLQCLSHLINKFKVYNSDKNFFEEKKDKYLYLNSIMQLLNQFSSCIYYKKEKIRQDELIMFENEINNHIKLLKEILIDEKNKDMPKNIKFYLQKLIEKSENNWKFSIKEEYKFKLLSEINDNSENNDNGVLINFKTIKETDKLHNSNEKKINLYDIKFKYGSPIRDINISSLVNTNISRSLTNKKKHNHKNIINKINTNNSNIKIITENKSSPIALIIHKNLILFKTHIDKFKTEKSFNNWTEIDELFLDKKYKIDEVIIELISGCELFLDNNENNKYYIDLYIKIVFEYYFNYLKNKDFDDIANRVLLEITNLKVDEKWKFDVWIIFLFYLMENKILNMRDFNYFTKGYNKDVKKNVMILLYEVCCYKRDKKYYYFKELKNSKFAMSNKNIYIDVIKEKNDKFFNGS